ncbi:hypothetical protein ACIFOT_12405 [Neobacillus sp. NRS-1170]|uniref:hypothetical protein n=1 Tax=Neobacillus sp. NRS-1170 TaxID=3233898 RepID=UPI003D27C518
MKNKIVINLKYWLLAFVLATSTFFSYFRYVTTDMKDLSNKIMTISYLLLFLLAVLLFNKMQAANYKKIWHSVFILCIPVLNLLFYMKFNLPKYELMFLENINGLQIILVTLLGVLIVKSSVLNSTLNRYYLVAFLFGCYYVFSTLTGAFVRNQYLNENTWGLFLAPYLIYLFVTYKKAVIRVIVFVIGSLLIYSSGAHTTLLSFVTLPIFMFVFNRVKRPRILFTILIVLGLFLVYFMSNMQSDLINRILTYRNLLWGAYLDNAASSFGTLIGGSGLWVIDNKIGINFLTRLGAHNTFISLLNYNGIIVLILYLCFMIFGIRKKANHFTVSDGVLYFAITFQFAESNNPLFAYIFPSIVFFLNLFINKESEDAENELKDIAKSN